MIDLVYTQCGNFWSHNQTHTQIHTLNYNLLKYLLLFIIRSDLLASKRQHLRDIIVIINIIITLF